MRLCPTCFARGLAQNNATTYIEYKCPNGHEWTVITQIVAKAVTP